MINYFPYQFKNIIIQLKSMKIFIDTADIDEIKEAMSWGIVDGVTTNPSLIKKSSGKKEMEEYIKEICRIAGRGRDVSLEVISLDADSMVREAKILYDKFNSVAGNVVIKIPICSALDEADKNRYEGLKALSMLSKENIPTNATLVMKPEQAILAAKNGAKYVSPFAGRLDDLLRDRAKIYGQFKDYKKEDYFPFEGVKINDKIIDDNGIISGVDLVREIVKIYKNYNFKTEVIAASIRNSRQVREIASTGVHIATVPFYVLKEMVYHQKTAEGIKKFLDDVVPEYRKLFE